MSDQADIRILRDLARRVREIAEDPPMAERRRRWHRLHALQHESPMILAETGGVLGELIPQAEYQCAEQWARGLERGFRVTLFQYEHVKDDHVVEPWINCGWQVSIGDYGVTAEKQRTENEGKLTSYRWEAALPDLDRDLPKLHFRELSVNREGTLQWKARLEEIFDGIMPVRIRGNPWWSMGMTWRAIELVGLEGLMLHMYDNPDGLHRLMTFLRDEHIHFVDWFEQNGLLNLNNGNDYVGSGGIGYVRDLPRPDWKEGDPVRLKDQWVLSESQETVGVSPQMFAEFIFPYQLAVAEKFGLCYYGCCEPVHSRWDSIRKFPNLRSVSVSPWCDEEIMAEVLGRKYVYCRKPNPALISRAHFDEDEIRADIRKTLKTAHDCNIEFAMKDVHTVADQPWRLGRWVEMVREEIATIW